LNSTIKSCKRWKPEQTNWAIGFSYKKPTKSKKKKPQVLLVFLFKKSIWIEQKPINLNRFLDHFGSKYIYKKFKLISRELGGKKEDTPFLMVYQKTPWWLAIWICHDLQQVHLSSEFEGSSSSPSAPSQSHALDQYYFYQLIHRLAFQE
jgi:hypothetical protein